MILSIILPVYNVEKYLEKCLRSCVNQDISYSDYEIIVVNDGSPDNSVVIAENYAKKYPNIIIINQFNQGLSSARNTGIMHAHGEYVWFIDSDDFIEENCLGRIVSYLQDDLDILQLQCRHVYEDDTPSLDIDFCRIDGIKSGLELMKSGGLPAPAPFSILRLKFLKDNKLEFLRGIYHEDSEFKPRATYLAKKIASDTCISYNYLQRLSGSITSNFKLKNGQDMLKVMNSLLSFADKQNMPERYRIHINRKIGMNMNSLLVGIRQLCKDDRLVLTNELKKNKHIFDCMIKSGVTKYQIEGIVFKVNIYMGLFLHHYMRSLLS